MKRIFFIAAWLLLSAASAWADGLNPVDTAKVWHHLAPTSGVQGVSTEEAYAFLQQKGRKSTPIVVAIIDSGTDIEHPDLTNQRWTNPKEIAGNGVDDDNNGYVDDVHGWNFIGGKDGRNITHETLEVTRLYRELSAKYGEAKAEDMKTKPEQEAYKRYLELKEQYEKNMEQAKGEFMVVMQIWMADSLLRGAIGKDDYDAVDLMNIQSDDERIQGLATHMSSMFANGLTRADIVEYKDYVDSKMFYQLNMEFDPRAEIIGDDPNNTNDRLYGNNDVIGTRCDHGTHVAGIVGATRANEIGIDGIADNVQLMILRTVPDGDERDKDVANAIIYAVDNGARIINMSFGKSTSTHKSAVDKALLYAQSKNVLLIHAAGNDGKNIDVEPNFPTPLLGEKGPKVKNFITVGASDGALSELVAGFSNYGKKHVDIFAPGVNVYSTYPNNAYKGNSGTSMAAPVVSGVAALVWSHYPSLKAEEVKAILLKSAIKHKKLAVQRPLSDKEKEGDVKPAPVKFAKLSQTGGVVNALEAVKLADKKAGK